MIRAKDKKQVKVAETKEGPLLARARLILRGNDDLNISKRQPRIAVRVISVP